jgi:hypothetical protein
MTWQTFYLACFLLGFVLAVLAFLGGSLESLGAIGHALNGHGFHFGHAPAPSVHGATPAGSHGASVPRYNLFTFMAFLAWFGGVGFLLSSRAHLLPLLVLGLALGAGVAGSAVIVGFLTRVLLRHERFLEAADFEMVGVLGRVTVPIRAGGTGEIVYSQANTRRSAGARSENGTAIARGAEVVVTRYERGLAYVRPWNELAGEETR